jgi:formate-dependent nitrite reductase cytochrome c552 subunit
MGAPGSGVSCATCHLPREGHGQSVSAQHDQSANLRPRDKMVRSVCMNCHGVGFSLDALADESLVRRNFNGLPSEHVQSLDMVERRLAEKNKQRGKGQ